jgi:hypothetical protein
MKKFKTVVDYDFYHGSRVHFLLPSMQSGNMATQLCHRAADNGDHPVTIEDLL